MKEFLHFCERANGGRYNERFLSFSIWLHWM